MNPVTVDARGQPCPKPLIMVKKALQDLRQGEALVVLIDNPTSKENVERFLKDNGVAFKTEREGPVFQIFASANASDLGNVQPEAYCGLSGKRFETIAHLVRIHTDKMGIGDDALGDMLMRAFVSTLKEISPLPGKIIFYNAGVRLTLKDSPVLDSLQELEKLGVEIWVCGTCVDYFKVKDQVRVGTLTNMYSIVEALTQARHVIAP